MIKTLLVAALGLALVAPAWAADDDKPNAGTAKGAAVGAAAGHEIGSGHAVAGAAAGAAIGHHEKSKAEKETANSRAGAVSRAARRLHLYLLSDDVAPNRDLLGRSLSELSCAFDTGKRILRLPCRSS